ncbi:C6 finger domain-containing protein [Pleurostoma richardsiae]|uniref:C6 finger domain-containing protein n=1 Tax=Pleurostoma richardsiae TaxID=41990 RepID=A0AA38VHH6_9PEZI|nr:C6 finger domain-containing protein [Pleurostoma richardsiae]
MRRSHRKSRAGCRECKRRHKKCDENRPACSNCSISDIPCSYLTTPPRSGPAVLRPLPSTASTTSLSPAAHSPASTGVSLPISGTFLATGDATPVFTLQHLELLHHFESGMLGSLDLDDTQVSHMSRTVFAYALRAPYLMDQILALSAAHLSTLRFDQRAMYLYEATQLQTRGLAQFNASRAQSNVSDGNVMPVFLYSSFLGLHVMFDTLLWREDFNEVLDRLTTYLSLHRGVRATTGQTWPLIEAELRPLIGGLSFDPPAASKGKECDPLMALIDQADFGETSSAACRQAAERLQWAFDVHRGMPTRGSRVNIVVAWPIVIPVTFVDLLRQRRPEALVILAYYAVLLHDSRDFWVFGNGGRFLLKTISTHLGCYWDEWLVWPNEMINKDRRDDG